MEMRAQTVAGTQKEIGFIYRALDRQVVILKTILSYRSTTHHFPDDCKLRTPLGKLKHNWKWSPGELQHPGMSSADALD